MNWRVGVGVDLPRPAVRLVNIDLSDPWWWVLEDIAHYLLRVAAVAALLMLAFAHLKSF